MTAYCRVSFPLAVNQAFLYRLPDELKNRVRPGSRVIAPLGSRKIKGYVLEVSDSSSEPGFQVKDLAGVIETGPVLSAKFLNFIRKLSARSLSPAGLFLELTEGPARVPETRLVVWLTDKGKEVLEEGKLRGKSRQLLELVSQKALSPAFLKKKLGDRRLSSRLKSLEQAGWIELKVKKRKLRENQLQAAPLPRQLSLPVVFPPEEGPAGSIFRALQATNFQRFLLTGEAQKRSELIVRVVDEVLKDEGYIFILVPEIEQTRRWLPLVKQLGLEAVFYHSRLTEKKRSEAWEQIISAKSRLVIGTRAILFLPVEPVRLIVIDEEQNKLYDQAENPAFEVREGAELRAREEGAVLLLSSSCPRVSSYYHAQSGGELIDSGEPEVLSAQQVVYLNQAGWLPEKIKEETEPYLKNGQQVFFFINRKGYAGYLFCPACGYVPRCEACQIALRLDKKKGELVCRYCGQSISQPEVCPVCGQKLRAGRVRGSQFLLERVKKALPDFELALVEESEDKKRMESCLKKIESGKIQVVIGTEYALSRLCPGRFSLVVIVEPEMSLNLPDFRAAEETFIRMFKASELLDNQPASKIIIITSRPGEPAIKDGARRDYLSFYRRELEYRRLLKYPPFSLLVSLSLAGSNLRQAARVSRRLMEELEQRFPALEIIGPKVKPGQWRKVRKEVRLYLRPGTTEGLTLLSQFLEEFSQTNSSVHLQSRLLF
ncbi:MAG: primosomal protein N' [Acidobacteriota bacterium]|nr:primosomal protein N' [Acidobacteriota bacterium]